VASPILVPRTPDLRPAWDRLVETSPDGWCWALFEWQELIAAVPEWGLVEAGFALAQDGRLLAVVPLHWVPARSALASSGWGWTGPILAAGLHPDHEIRLWEAIYRELRVRAAGYGARRIEVGSSPLTPRALVARWGINPFKRFGFQDTAGESRIIRLDQSDEAALWAGLSKTARYTVRQARAAGYTVRRVAWPEWVDDYIRIHVETYRRTGVSPHPRAYFDGIAGTSPDHAVLWAGYAPNGRVVAFHNSAWFKEAGMYLTGCSETGHLKSGVNYLLLWEAILGAKAAGLRWYEVGAVDYACKGDKMAGLTHLKSSFGGEDHRSFRGCLELDARPEPTLSRQVLCRSPGAAPGPVPGSPVGDGAVSLAGKTGAGHTGVAPETRPQPWPEPWSPPAMTPVPTPRFEFGRNWQRFLERSFSEERVAIAGRHLLGFLQRERLDGLRVLDIGCGSGLHSLAMVRAGAASVVSFDYDPHSVAAARWLHVRAGAPGQWSIGEGSILDPGFLAGLGTFDLVYAWGVLHHTGDLWQALANTVPLLAPTGRLYVALYASEVHIDPSPEDWLVLKQRYNRVGRFRRGLMEADYLWRFLLGRRLVKVLDLPRIMREYQRGRGMSLLTDVRDWLGGWPMEFSSGREVLDLMGGRFGLELVNLKLGEANTEYLFVPAGTAAELGYGVISKESLAVRLFNVIRSLADLDVDAPVYIFGTAQGAELLLAEFRRHPELQLGGFIDIEWSGKLGTLPVIQVDRFLDSFPPDTPVLLSNRYVVENGRRLLAKGFSRIYNGHPLVMRLAQAGYRTGGRR